MQNTTRMRNSSGIMMRDTCSTPFSTPRSITAKFSTRNSRVQATQRVGLPTNSLNMSPYC